MYNFEIPLAYFKSIATKFRWLEKPCKEIILGMACTKSCYIFLCLYNSASACQCETNNYPNNKQYPNIYYLLLELEERFIVWEIK